MDEKEIRREYRRWHFLDFLGVITWVMNRGIRGRSLVEFVPPRLDPTPPMVELDRLVKLAAAGNAPDLALDAEQLGWIVELFNQVALKDGMISPEETAAMKVFIEAQALPETAGIDAENYLTAFNEVHQTDANLKETCHLLRTRLRPGAAEQIVEALYLLAHQHGLDENERRLVERIGEYLGLMSSEIRIAESAARRRNVEPKDV